MAYITGFSQYPKVQNSYESFHKSKWHKANKQLPFIYMEQSLSAPRPKKSPLLSFSGTLGYILLAQMDKINRDKAHRHSSQLWGLDAERLGVIPGEGLGGLPSLCRVWVAPVRTDRTLFLLSTLFPKRKSPLQVSFDEWKQVLM